MAIFASVTFVSFRPNLPPPPPRCPVKRGQQSLPAYRHGTCRGNALFAPNRPLTLSRRPDDFRCLVFQSPAGDDVGENHEDEEAAADNKSGEEEEWSQWLQRRLPSFVQHIGRTFVVAISSKIVTSRHLETLLKDISLLHCFGLKFVLVPGADEPIDLRLVERGLFPKYAGPFRITDPACLEIAKKEIEGVSVTIQDMISGGSDDFRVKVVTGKFFEAERRSHLDAFDFGATGYVKKVNGYAIREGLDSKSIVLIPHLGFSSSGEALYCDIYELAKSCASAVGAEKVIHVEAGPFEEKTVKPPFSEALPVDGSVDGALLEFFIKRN